MISKDERSKILSRFNEKNDKIFASNLIEIINKFVLNNYIMYTKFLNLYERSIAISILNKYNINYRIYLNNEWSERALIFLLPEEILNEGNDMQEIFSKYIKCVKIIPSVKNKLVHKDYMGAIYSLGITEENIGDIFISDDKAYFFIFNDNLNYFKYNLNSVGRSSVKIEILSITEEEVEKLKSDYKNVKIIISSLRIDNILAHLFKLSRNEVKNKIEKGELFVNSKPIYFLAQNIKVNDIVSLKRCGKFKIGEIKEENKKGKYVINIKKYI